MVNSKLFVDRRESTLNEAGDFLFPKKEGAIGDDHIRGEIGDILLDRIGGRSSAEEITLFKSLGLAVEDVAAAHYIYQKLLEQDEGVWVEFGALKSDYHLNFAETTLNFQESVCICIYLPVRFCQAS